MKSKWKNRLRSLAPIIIFMIGAGIFLYPTIANRIAIYQQSRDIETYETKLDEVSQKEIEDAWEEAMIYNDNLAGDPVHDPFVLNSGYALPDNYKSVLNMGDNDVMAYIEIPTIGAHLPIYHGTSDKVLALGVGHIEGTSLPIGGTFRHSVLCAHRGLPSAELFTRLDELKKGDLFYIHVLDKVLAYEVDSIEVVLPEEITPYLYASQGDDFITLMTCTPIGSNTHRILVRGKRTEYVPKVKEQITDTKGKHIEYFHICLIILVVISICILGVKAYKGLVKKHE